MVLVYNLGAQINPSTSSLSITMELSLLSANPVLLPFVIFFARILDVSLGTVRIMFVNRSMKGTATLLGFLEVLVWVTITAQIFGQLDNIFNYLAYAGGFAAGNYIGIWIEEKLRIGTQIFRIITDKDTNGLLAALKLEGINATILDARGSQGPVQVIFTVVKRKNEKKMFRIIDDFDPKAFYSIEDIKYVSQYLEHPEYGHDREPFSALLSTRKSF